MFPSYCVISITCREIIIEIVYIILLIAIVDNITLFVIIQLKKKNLNKGTLGKEKVTQAQIPLDNLILWDFWQAILLKTVIAMNDEQKRIYSVKN